MSAVRDELSVFYKYNSKYGGMEPASGKTPSIEHITPLRKLRQWHGDILEDNAGPVEVLTTEMGLAPTAQRAIKIAVGILAEIKAAESRETLDSLLESDL